MKRQGWRKHSAVAVLLAALGALTLPSAASASEVEVVGTTIQYTADPGEDNDLIISPGGPPNTYTINDSSTVTIDNMAGLPECVGGGAAGADAVCTVTGLTAITITLDDLDDDADTTMIPDPVATTMVGGAGNDVMQGGAGGDSFAGGLGVDEVTYADRSASVDADPDAGASFDDGVSGEGDNIGDDIENVTGGTVGDFLAGNGLNNTLTGGGGGDSLDGKLADDTLKGGAGADLIDGKGGNDTADFTGAGVAITADLGAGTATGEGSDSLTAIENLRGDSGNDIFTGDGTPNVLDGEGGSDTLTGLGDNDTLLGGLGNDSGGSIGLFGGSGADDLQGEGGNDLLNGGADADTNMSGGGEDDTLIGGPGDETLDGNAGTDTASYAGTTGNVTANLATSSATGEGNDTLANIDNLTGGSGNDTLTGDGANNALDGGTAGNDTASFGGVAAGVNANLRTSSATGQGTDTLANIDNLTGSSMDDTLVSDGNANTLDGGSGGVDTVSFAGNTGGVMANLATGTSIGDGTDTLTSVDNLNGGSGDDTLTSSSADNTLNGGTAGNDTASFSAASTGVTATTTSATGDGTDTLTAIDNLTGSGNIDSLTGDANANILKGGNDDDTINGGAQNDSIQGEGGTGDTASFAGAASGITADLRAGTATGDGSDTLSGIENLTGSSNNDTLGSDANGNTLDGGAGGADTATFAGNTSGVNANLAHATSTGDGTDTLTNIDNVTGGSGDDLLTSSPGNNVLNGGSAGSDTGSFANNSGGVTADLGTGLATGDGSDTLTALDNLTGGTGPDSLNGDNNPNTLNGGDDGDTLRGKFGIDQVHGQGGSDPLVNGGPDGDTLTGGIGVDTLQGDDGNDALKGNAGIDSLNGGNNTDTANYEDAGGAVTASLQAGTATNDGDGASDTLTELENLTGSIGGDNLTGSTGVSNTLSGLAGNDLLNLRDGGADTASAECGADIDTVIADASGTDTINVDCEKVDFPGTPDTTINTGPAHGGSTNDNTPTFTFSSTEPGSTFQCQVDGGGFSSCTSPHTTTMLADGSRTFQVRAIDPVAGDDANPDTDQSPDSRTFNVDATAPATPSITDTDPDSPANDNTPEVKGTAEAGSTVRLYSDATCTGTVLAMGTASAFASPGLTPSPAVADNSTTNFRVTATDADGNPSACSAPFAYVEDSAVPATPSITDTDPDSPANDNTPEVKGTAEAGSTVRLYSGANCNGTVLAMGPAATFASPGLTPNPGVADDSTTNFRVTATDGVGNVSACSAPFAYIEDSGAPDTSITGGPSGPTNDNTPSWTFTTPDGTTFQCSIDGAAFTTCTSGQSFGALSEGAHTFAVRARDAVGNVDPSPATRSITVDTVAPDTSILNPRKKTRDRTPTFNFATNEPGSGFACKVDAGIFLPCNSSATFRLRPGSHTLSVQSTDAAGNVDSTPATLRFKILKPRKKKK